MKIFIYFILCIFLFSIKCYAAPPMPGKPGTQIGPKDGVGSIWQRRETGTNIKGALPFTTEEARVIVLRVEFADGGSGYTGAPSGKLITSREDTEELMEKLRGYYQEVSYGQLDLEIEVTQSIYQLSHSMDYYGSGNERPEDLLKNAVRAADTDIVFSDFDAVIVYHAGFGQESNREVVNDIWSVFLSVSPILTNDGVTIREGSIVPEKESGASPLGVIAHEFGHQLGLPDLYNTDTQKSVIGSWGLMDAGAWLGNGFSPGHLCAWSKAYLGWIVPLSVSSESVNEVYQIENYQNESLYKIMVKGKVAEYFLISNRQRWGYDSALPGDGLLIWHIDDNIGSIGQNTVNNYDPPRVYLENGRPFYQGGKDAFTSNTTPNSDANDGSYSGVALKDISHSQEMMYVGVQITPVGEIFAYPNPTYNGQTTIRFMPSSRGITAQEIKIAIYDISGELVLETGGNKIDTYFDPFLYYEYHFDGKNKAGKKVASGIYIYCIKCGKETECNKMAVKK
ncbi:M6 family metalloprotease domain-containing protein [bacterium]|nr:M6 family metalloprotease domain-containing protein [bacterium]MBU1614741.1 M6 family metalloprotease domain-containing protein [bacterium]